MNEPWKLLRNQGIAFLVIGILAILAPFVFTLAIAVLVGIAILLGGIVLAQRVFEARGRTKILVPAVWAGLYILVGIILLVRPELGAITLTLVLALAIGAQGVFQIAAAWEREPRDTYGVVSGLASLLLALLIWLRLPSSAAWAIGLLVGVSFLFNGAALLALGRLVKERAAASAT